MTDLIIITILAFASGAFLVGGGLTHYIGRIAAERDSLRAKLTRLTDRDQRGRFVRRETKLD